MLIFTHSLLHTQCSIHSASASSFSVLVYPVHHLQSLPIPSLLLASHLLLPSCVSRCRVPMYFHRFVPVRPASLSSFIIGLLIIVVLTLLSVLYGLFILHTFTIGTDYSAHST